MANGVETFLSAVGKKFGEVFSWLGSKQGQATIAGVETAGAVVATAINPALGVTVTGVEGLVNAGLTSAINIETVAAAAGQQSGTGTTQKAAAVATALTSNAASFLKSIGVNDATAAEVQNLATVIGTASADILNAIPARAAVTPAA